MKNRFSKKYSPKEIEEKIYSYWEKNDFFSPEKIKEIKWEQEEKFSITMPPPNVTWVLHLWHAQTLTVEDIMVRYNRMKWKSTVWIPWTDHAWIATQVIVENQLKKDWISRDEIWREKFLEKVWEWVKYSRSTILSQVKTIWASCDWSREEFTLSEHFSRAVRKAFVELYEKEKIYKSSYIVNRCSNDRTVISDIEVEYKEKEWKLYYINYFVEWKWYYIPVATVRPETIFGDVAVAVNPYDKRYKKYIGKNVLIPIINKPIPIIADEWVDISFGTWVLKITPTHDSHDFEIWKKHWLPLDHYAIASNWKLTELAWEFAGHKVEDVFENIIQYLDEIGNLEKVEKYTNNQPFCERCGSVIQPMVSEQWFMDVSSAAESCVDYVKNKEIDIYPERFNKTFFNWLENITPWCISRQLRWWHRIPVRYCPNSHTNVFTEDDVFEKESEYEVKIISMIIFNLIVDSRLENPFNIEGLINLLFSDSLTPQKWKVFNVYLQIYKNKYKENKDILKALENLEKLFFSLKEKSISDLIEGGSSLIDFLEQSNQIKSKWDFYEFEFECKVCGEKKIKQETDVLDTWFSSWLWPFGVLWWPENTQDFEDYFPNTVLETWWDILFFWVARMMILSNENLQQKPFSNIYLHWLINDRYGKKMSKSKWNTVNPLDAIEKYWTDALRLAVTVGSTPWTNINFSEEKLEYSYRFINKLWNAIRFIYVKVLEEKNDVSIDVNAIYEDINNNLDKLNDFDKRIINQINHILKESDKLFEKFMIWDIAHNLIQVVWHDFCDWYIEISKLEKSEYTDKVLLYSVSVLLKLLHPYIPFVTEKLWYLLWFEGALILADYPEVLNIWKNNSKLNLLMDVISEYRNLRHQSDLKPHEKVKLFLQWNNSFLDFVKSYDSLVKNLLNADEIEYLNESEEVDWEYNVSVVADINVWLKVKRQIDWTEKMKQLEKELSEEKQFLQNLRNMLATPWFLDNAPQKVVDDKQEKMENVKERITKLEYEINKLKMNKK